MQYGRKFLLKKPPKQYRVTWNLDYPVEQTITTAQHILMASSHIVFSHVQPWPYLVFTALTGLQAGQDLALNGLHPCVSLLV